MIQKNIRDYLTAKEQKRFDIDNLCQKYVDAKQYRSDRKAEAMMEVGIRVWMEDFQQGVFGNAEENQSWINIIWEKVYKKISRMVASDIYIGLENLFNRNIMSQNMLEKNINYALDYFDLLRKTDLALLWRYFTGFGCVKTSWDKWDTRQGWETGIPTLRTVDSRAIYLPSNIQQDNMADITRVFEQCIYDKDIFEEKLKSGLMQLSKDKVDKIIDEINMNHDDNNLWSAYKSSTTLRNQTVEVVVCQYNRPEIVKVRKLKNYVSADQTIYEVLEEELIKEIGKENLDKATDKDDDEALPEGMRASEPEYVKYNAWYEVQFVPGSKTVICPPQCIGDKLEYSFMTGVKSPNSSYPISEAFRQASAQSIFNEALTQYLVHALMQHKSIPAYVKQGIANFDEFIQNYEEQDVGLEIEEEWFQRNGGNIPFKFIPPRSASPALRDVLNMMNMAISESTASTPILAGESPGSHASGAQVSMLSRNALDSSKSEFYPYQSFLKNICEILKDKIAEYKNYVHKDEFLGMEVLVNSSLNTQMINTAPNCYVVVKDQTGEEGARQIKADRYERLLMQNIVPYEIAIHNMELENPDEIISMHRQQEPIYDMVKKLEAKPELMPHFINYVNQLLTQAEASGTQPAQPDQTASEQPA